MASQFPQTQVQKVPRTSNRKQDATVAKNASPGRPGDHIGPKAPVTPGRDGRVRGSFLFTDWASI